MALAVPDARDDAAAVLPDAGEKAAVVQSMFDRIAPRYDRLNAVMTFRLDRAWRRATIDAAEIRPGDRVLDVACGTGAFSRAFAEAVAPGGLVCGLDASQTMLERAASAERPANLGYVRGDAMALPFSRESFDAVCCFAALYLIEDPWRAIDELVRVLAPNGRIALLASVHRGPLPIAPARSAMRSLTGVRLFSREELADGLRERGLTRVRVGVAGMAQFVSGRRD